jgi:hypothetical protein
MTLGMDIPWYQHLKNTDPEFAAWCKTLWIGEAENSAYLITCDDDTLHTITVHAYTEPRGWINGNAATYTYTIQLGEPLKLRWLTQVNQFRKQGQ